MALSLTQTALVRVTAGQAVTNNLLRLLALSPSVSISGSVGTADLAAGAVTAAKATPGAYFYGATSGTNTYTLNPNPALAALADGVEVLGKIGTTNTAAATATLAVNSLTAKNIYHRNGTAVKPGDLVATDIVRFRYNSSRNSAAGGWDVMEVLPSALIRPATNDTTGTATTQALTSPVGNTPPLTGYYTGALLLVKVGSGLTNTGAVTLNCDGLGTRNVLRPGGAALLAGDWVAGQTYLLYDDGTQFILLTKDRDVAVAAAVRNLTIQNNTAAPVDKLDITADEVVLKSSNGLPLLVTSVSVTADFTLGVALNGLETSGTRVVSHWWYVWLISDGTNVRAVLEDAGAGDGAVPGGPDLTNAAFLGYIYKGLVGQARLNGTGAGELVQFLQYDRSVFTEEQVVMAVESVTTLNVWQILDNAPNTNLTFFRAAVPPTARTCGGVVGTDNGTDNVQVVLGPVKDDGTLATTQIGAQLFNVQNIGTTLSIPTPAGNVFGGATAFGNLPVRGGASRGMQFKSLVVAQTVNLSITSYTF